MDFEKLTEAEKEDLLAKATSLETMSKLNLPKDILEKIAGGGGTERVEEGEPCPRCDIIPAEMHARYRSDHSYCVFSAAFQQNNL